MRVSRGSEVSIYQRICQKGNRLIALGKPAFELVFLRLPDSKIQHQPKCRRMHRSGQPGWGVPLLSRQTKKFPKPARVKIWLTGRFPGSVFWTFDPPSRLYHYRQSRQTQHAPGAKNPAQGGIWSWGKVPAACRSSTAGCRITATPRRGAKEEGVRPPCSS
jgi:hypothetical protein